MYMPACANFVGDGVKSVFTNSIFSWLFMLFSALKLIGETVHELGMLFFSKDYKGETMSAARGGYVIFSLEHCCLLLVFNRPLYCSL